MYDGQAERMKDIDRISFTGSTGTAGPIGQAAAKIVSPIRFEPGGQPSFIVLAADLDAAARMIAAQIGYSAAAW